jgi:hypothetical protein
MIGKIYFSILKYFLTTIKLRIFNSLGANLSKLFEIAGTPKHKEAYDAFCGIVKKERIFKILEIGIGGHDNPNEGGRSLLALKIFFKNAHVIGADIIKKNKYIFNRVSTKLLDQGSNDDIKNFAKKFGNFDLIIDDGSHFCKHQKNSFEILFKFLNYDGFYIVEDTNNSYKPAGGGSINLNSKKSTVNLFKEKVHAVNSSFLISSERKKIKKYIDISCILFFPGIIIIQKKKNKPNKTDKYLNLTLRQFNDYWSKIKGFEIEKNKSGVLFSKKNIL